MLLDLNGGEKERLSPALGVNQSPCRGPREAQGPLETCVWSLRACHPLKLFFSVSLTQQ